MIQYRKLIDVSSHNGTINWKKVKESGVDYAILRLGYAENKVEYDDKKFLENVKGCIENDIEWGTYLYSYANKISDAMSELAHIHRRLNEVKEMCKENGFDEQDAWPELGVFYDLEDEGTTGKCSNEEIQSFAESVIENLKFHKYITGIYANLNWFKNKLSSDWYRIVPNHLWLAHYITVPSNEDPVFLRYSEDYSIWQYSAKGVVDGIYGNVDLNVIYYDDGVINCTQKEIEEYEDTLKEKEEIHKEVLEKVLQKETAVDRINEGEEIKFNISEVVDIVEEIEDTENGVPVEIEEDLDKALENTVYNASLNLKKALNDLGNVIVEEVARVGEKIVNSFKGLGKLFKK